MREGTRTKSILVLALLAALPVAAETPAPAPPAAKVPTIDEIMTGYFDAIGGKEKLEAVRTMRMTGTMIMGRGMKAPVTIEMKRPKSFRSEFTFQGQKVITVFDGANGWAVVPFLGTTEPQPIPAEQLEDVRQSADMDGPLVDFAEKGYALDFVGKETLDGAGVYNLRIAAKNGDVQNVYLDAERFLPVRVVARRKIEGKEMEIEVILGDYKEVSGLRLPHSIERKLKELPQGQRLTYQKIELNPEIDDARFKKP